MVKINKIKKVQCIVELEDGTTETQFVPFEVLMIHAGKCRSDSGYWEDAVIEDIRNKHGRVHFTDVGTLYDGRDN